MLTRYQPGSIPKIKFVHGNLCDISFVDIILTVIGTSFVAVTVIYGVEQLKETSKATKANVFVILTNLLQDEKIRQDRKIVFSLEHEGTIKPYTDWTEDEREAVQAVLASFDQVGCMIKNKILDPFFLDTWNYAMYKIFFITQAFMEHKKEVWSDDYYPGIDALLSLKPAKKYNFEEVNGVSCKK